MKNFLDDVKVWFKNWINDVLVGSLIFVILFYFLTLVNIIFFLFMLFFASLFFFALGLKINLKCNAKYGSYAFKAKSQIDPNLLNNQNFKDYEKEEKKEKFLSFQLYYILCYLFSAYLLIFMIMQF
jgi:hypothetical protein